MADRKKLLVAALTEQLKTGKPVRIPAGGNLLWAWFSELSRARTMHAAGPNPITFSDIAAFNALRGLDLKSHHLDILLAMDNAYLEHHVAAQARPPEGTNVLPPISKRTLSASLFDTMVG